MLIQKSTIDHCTWSKVCSQYYFGINTCMQQGHIYNLHLQFYFY